jgi:hypothetical protein
MFDTVNYLLHEKNKSDLDVELLQTFNPFITTKCFSFYDSGKYCDFINNTLNVYSNIFQNVEDQFNFYDNIIPKLKRRKSEYIKKSKIEKEKIEIEHQIPDFLSKREIDYYNNLTCTMGKVD